MAACLSLGALRGAARRAAAPTARPPFGASLPYCGLAVTGAQPALASAASLQSWQLEGLGHRALPARDACAAGLGDTQDVNLCVARVEPHSSSPAAAAETADLGVVQLLAAWPCQPEALWAMSKTNKRMQKKRRKRMGERVSLRMR
mmetsp:Transcript_44417/g.99958  ORF Transcript_44417/g.99958 Transcript_44417/m.99958 type:complete len:146 (-) Transcript_44417:50-487(-)